MNERLQYILLKSYWEGRVYRQDLIDRFNIASTQATKDLRQVRSEMNGAIEYNPSLKRYIPGEHIEHYVDNSSFTDYARLALGKTDAVLFLSPSPRSLDPQHYRTVIQAITDKRAMRFNYLSLNSPGKPEARVLYPHHIISSGFRWHFRGYEPESGGFKDFSFSRVSGPAEIDKGRPAKAMVAMDSFWETEIEVILTPNPVFNEGRQAVIAADYGMTNNRLAIHCRAACVLYVLRNFEVTDFSATPNHYQLLTINNREALLPYLP